jgi:hypothetical protein
VRIGKYAAARFPRWARTEEAYSITYEWGIRSCPGQTDQAEVLAEVAGEGEMSDMPIEAQVPFAIGGGSDRVHVGKRVGDLVDRLLIDGPCVGAGGG